MDSRHKVDQISSLHDSILIHLLTFLPTKETVATSILSKRWRFVWTKVPVIDIDLEEERLTDEKKNCYQNFVTNVLFLNKESCLRHCRLTLPCGIDSSSANAWIDNILKRGVEVLDFKDYVHVEFSSSVFTFEKLKAFTCRGYFCRQPTSIHLPNLCFLKLSGISIVHASFLEQLTSCCPVLHELVIDYCVSGGEVNVCSSSLKKLLIMETEFLYEIVIDAPSLEYLMLSLDYPLWYDMRGLSSIKEADIDLPIFIADVLDPVSRANILDFVDCLASSTTLRLRTTKVLNTVLQEIYTFDELVCLELSDLLDRTPNLVHLTIACHPIEIFKYPVGSHGTHVPKCLLHRIKVIEIREFDGSDSAMEMVSYLLLSASVLNKMKIYWISLLSPPEETQILMKLMSFPRGSSACKVTMFSASSVPPKLE